MRVLPLTDADARRLIESLTARAAARRRRAPIGRAATCRGLLLRLAWVVEHLPELADVELNPVLAAGDAVSITAARVRVAPAAWTPDPEVRRLH